MTTPLTNPTVSILIAARNEEQNILNLLNSVSMLNYPENKLEVLIGDDGSTDQTAKLVREFILNKPQIKLYDIQPSTTHLRGKTNALTQLAKIATGDYFFFTDADITLPVNWVENMLTGFRENVGVVVGSTVTSPISLFARCQGIEWLSVLNFMEICGRFNIPTTGMGNNMAVSRKAYEAVGGYDSIPFSIVEDYALYNAIVKKGFGFKHLYKEEVLTFTEPPEDYFRQRKRWVSGGVKSRSPLLIVAFLQALLLPFTFILLTFNQAAGQFLLLTAFCINILLGFVALLNIRLTKWVIYLPIYSIYVIVFWFLQLINFALPGDLIWKGRKY